MDTGLRAGAAQVDVTPEPGVQLAGNIGVRRPAETIQDRLYVRALALESEGRRVCLLSSDVLAIRGDYVETIRRRAHAQHGLDPACLLVNCTQNHHAPSVGHCFCLDEAFWRRWVPPELEWVLGGDPRYYELFVERAVQAIGQAWQRLTPVTVHAGRAIEGRLMFNRRCVLRDGTAVMHPPIRDPKILQVEGPMDPEVSLVTLRTAQGEPVAALLHHTGHPDHRVPATVVAGGWPGAWCDAMRAVLGETAVALVMNGCCGNIHPRNPLVDMNAEYRQIGRTLTDDCRDMTAQLAEPRATPAGRPALACLSKNLRIPLRPLDPAAVEKARQFLAQHPAPLWLDTEKTRISWDWIYAISTLDLAQHRERQPYFDYEIQVFRLADVALVALVGEPFVEAQLEIKLRSPYPFTQVVHMSNGYVGYVPTRAALARGGFETRTAHWSKLAPEALESITQEALALLRQI